MAFKNELSFSASRLSTLEECPKRYWFNYYGHWGGWDYDATPLNTRIYRLKNLDNIYSWSGCIVHDVIKRTLVEFKAYGEKFSLTRMKALAKDLLRQDYRKQLNFDITACKKSFGLIEAYGNGGKLTPEQVDEVKQRVYTSLELFYTGKTIRKIAKSNPENWKSIEDMAHFELHGVKCWVSMDFAYIDSDGDLHIVDWKTGSPSPAHSNQLALYARYAMEKWCIPMENIVVEDVYIKDEEVIESNRVDLNMMESFEQYVDSSVHKLRSGLVDVENNVAREEDFQATPGRNTCRLCNFKKVCDSYAKNQ